LSRSSLRWLAPATFLLLWSAGFAFVALGLPDSEPITFLALRYAIVVAVLLAAFAALRPPLPQSRRDCCSPSRSTSRAQPGPLP
jgi:drug/metabolite transporter (DMT)-like permease